MATEAFDRDPTSPANVLVGIRGLTKRYALATVLRNVTFDILAGEVHAVVGENGAGKSTLARCIAGFVEPNDGIIIIDGESVSTFSVGEAERRGVVLIHQELALADHLSVVANMFLGHELHSWSVLNERKMAAQAAEMLAQLGCTASPWQVVSDLPVSDRQMVEIAKALLRRARLIVMDEPTAVLTPREAENLFTQIDRLRREGVSVIYVSHKLDEVKRIADRVTVLRDGKYQGTWLASELSVHAIANLMVGRELEQVYPVKAGEGDRRIALEVNAVLGETSRSPVSFAIRKGEILGVAGLVGSGRTELFESIVGLRRIAGGDLKLNGNALKPASYRDALARGVAYITEDRKGRGLLLAEPIGPNVSVLDQILKRQTLVDFAAERRSGEWAISTFQIELPFNTVRVGRLSGGNQQKVLLAKSLLNAPDVIIVDEPTRGIDVGTRAEIYRLLRQLADTGKAVVVISSDLQEIVGLSDRVLVMRDNELAGILSGADVDERTIVQLATGARKMGDPT